MRRRTASQSSSLFPPPVPPSFVSPFLLPLRSATPRFCVSSLISSFHLPPFTPLVFRFPLLSPSFSPAPPSSPSFPSLSSLPLFHVFSPLLARFLCALLSVPRPLYTFRILLTSCCCLSSVSIARSPCRRASPSALPSSNLGSKPWSCLRHALSAMDQAIPRVPRCLFAGCAPSVVAGPSATLRRKRSFVDARVRLSFAVAPILLVPAPDCVAFRSAALFCVRARLAVAVPLRRGLGVCALPALLRARPKVLGGIS